MRVLLFTNLFPTRAETTRGIFTLQLAQELARLCDLSVAVPLPWFPEGALGRCLLPRHARQFGGIGREWSHEGIRARYLRYPLLPRLSERYHPRLMELGVQHWLESEHARQPWQVINAHWLFPDGVAAARIARRLRIPVVLTALGCDANEFLQDAAKGPQIIDALRYAGAVTAVSSALGDALLRAGVPEKRLTIIPNGVDTLSFQPRNRAECRRVLGLPVDCRLVVCVSRHSPEKGVGYLIDAAPALFALNPATHIALVGDGPQRQELESRVRKLGLGDRVHFAGSVAYEAVAQWLGAADVSCIPSLREGHPNAAMESLASGRPIVASRVGALPGMISDKLGALVSPGDAGELAAALGRAIEQPWDPDAIAASVRSASWSAAAKKYFSAAESVAAHT